MFAGAAREVVFSNPDVVRRVNQEFIPVALKAALVNNPPPGAEGRLYAEIGRSKPAPQGICVTNSAGKVLSWTLGFDQSGSIVKFLNHVLAQYKATPDAAKPVTAEQYMRFPTHPLKRIADNGVDLLIPDGHGSDACPAELKFPKGTLVGKVIGRALDKNGNPVKETTLQENYMEAKFQISPQAQQQLTQAVAKANKKRFTLPHSLAMALVQPAYLGQLDVDPTGTVPGSANDRLFVQFEGQVSQEPSKGRTRIFVTGSSDAAGGQSARGVGDGRIWDHEVTLSWQGYLDLQEDRIVELVAVADGQEHLRWGSLQFQLSKQPKAQMLMAGHPINLKTAVRYGLMATIENKNSPSKDGN